jgi:KTSC domain
MTTIIAHLASTSLAVATYDAHLSRLQIHFKDGTAYDYSGVPQSLFHHLLAAPSKGRFFNAYIRNRFPCQEVAG